MGNAHSLGADNQRRPIPGNRPALTTTAYPTNGRGSKPNVGKMMSMGVGNQIQKGPTREVSSWQAASGRPSQPAASRGKKPNVGKMMSMGVGEQKTKGKLPRRVVATTPRTQPPRLPSNMPSTRKMGSLGVGAQFKPITKNKKAPVTPKPPPPPPEASKALSVGGETAPKPDQIQPKALSDSGVGNKVDSGSMFQQTYGNNGGYYGVYPGVYGQNMLAGTGGVNQDMMTGVGGFNGGTMTGEGNLNQEAMMGGAMLGGTMMGGALLGGMGQGGMGQGGMGQMGMMMPGAMMQNGPGMFQSGSGWAPTYFSGVPTPVAPMPMGTPGMTYVGTPHPFFGSNSNSSGTETTKQKSGVPPSKDLVSRVSDGIPDSAYDISGEGALVPILPTKTKDEKVAPEQGNRGLAGLGNVGASRDIKGQTLFLCALTEKQLQKAAVSLDGDARGRGAEALADQPVVEPRDSKGVCYLGKLHLTESSVDEDRVEEGVAKVPSASMGHEPGSRGLWLHTTSHRKDSSHTDNDPAYNTPADYNVLEGIVGPQESFPVTALQWVAPVPSDLTGEGKMIMKVKTRHGYKECALELLNENAKHEWVDVARHVGAESTMTPTPRSSSHRYHPDRDSGLAPGQFGAIYLGEERLATGVISRSTATFVEEDSATASVKLYAEQYSRCPDQYSRDKAPVRESSEESRLVADRQLRVEAQERAEVMEEEKVNNMWAPSSTVSPPMVARKGGGIEKMLASSAARENNSRMKRGDLGQENETGSIHHWG